MKRLEIEIRARIAEASEATPGMSYQALIEKFHTSSRVVADALGRSSGEWRAMLGEPGLPRWEYMVGQVKPILSKGKMVYEWHQEGLGNPELLEADGLFDVLNQFGGDGWELVSLVLVKRENKEPRFTGTYELAFKRRA